MAPGVPFEARLRLTKEYRTVILFSIISYMKWGRDATYSKVTKDLEAASLRLQHINFTDNVSAIEPLLEDLKNMVEPLEKYESIRFSIVHPYHGFAINLVNSAVGMFRDDQTFVKQFRVRTFCFEWNRHLDSCYKKQTRDLLERRIQNVLKKPSPTPQCCSKKKLLQQLSEIPPFVLEADFRKKKYFQWGENITQLPCRDLGTFYKKFFPVFVKCTVLFMRDGVNETCNEMKDGLESISAQVIELVTLNKLSELHRPFNDLINLEMQYEDVLQTIDIDEYKAIFDEWDMEQIVVINCCRKCEPFKNFFKSLNEEINRQAKFTLIMFEFLCPK